MWLLKVTSSNLCTVTDAFKTCAAVFIYGGLPGLANDNVMIEHPIQSFSNWETLILQNFVVNLKFKFNPARASIGFFPIRMGHVEVETKTSQLGTHKIIT
jgi:hypothetical protein